METDFGTVMADQPDMHSVFRAGVLCKIGNACGWKSSLMNYGGHIVVTCFKDDGKKIRFEIDNTHAVKVNTNGYKDIEEAKKDVNDILDLASQTKGLVYDSDRKDILTNVVVK